MTLSGLFFLVLGLLIVAFICARRLFESRCLPFALFFYHLAASLFYWQWSLRNPADAKRYYRAAVGYDLDFHFGTKFIEWLVQKIYIVFAPSYLDYFLLFQISGFLGLCYLYRMVMEAFVVPPSARVRQFLVALLFLPGLHFWTCAIGKDGLIFLGITLSLWSLLNLRTRWFGYLVGFFIVLLIRPHIATFLLAATMLGGLCGRGRWLWRSGGLISGIVACVFVAPFVMDFLHLDSLSLDTLNAYIEKRQGFNQSGGSSVDIREYPFWLKLFTYMYRPLFVDAPGFLGLFVSVENLVLLLMSTVLLSPSFIKLVWQHPKALLVRSSLFYFFISLLALSLTTANMGLAIRQKIMILPCLILLVVLTCSYWGKAKSPRSYGVE